jgi:hypothetical protein
MKKLLTILMFFPYALAFAVHAQSVSPDGSSITPSSGGSLVTSDGIWTFGTQTDSDGTQIFLNGSCSYNNPSDGCGTGVKLVAYQNRMYMTNTSGNWYVWDDSVKWWDPSSEPPTSGGVGGGSSMQGTSCTGTLTDYYQPSIATPTGYGASYDLFSPQHELEVQVQNCPANTITMTVGSNQSNQYVYNKGYLYQSGSWQSISLNGTVVSGSTAWDSGLATASLNVTPTSWTYAVGYVCAWNGTVWQCGCANTACATNYWQLQAFENSQAAGDSSAVWDTTVNSNATVIAPNGNDSNPCTAAAPCQSLGRAQQAVRSSSTKIVYLRAGTYSIGSTVSLDDNDNGEIWQSYPTDGANSAVLDGDNSVNLFNLGTSSNVTINGIKMQHVYSYAVANSSGGSNVTLENCDIGFNQHTSDNGGFNPIIGLGGANTKILHNYVHDTPSQGIGIYAYDSGSTIDGSVIEGNVVLRTVQQMNDGGAIYSDMRNTNVNGGHFTIENNFIRDYGNSSTQAEGIYLDDDTSNATVSGNVIGPPDPGNNNSTTGNWGNTIANAGCCNIWTGNIFDLGSSGAESIASTGWEGTGGSLFFNWTAPNTFKDNIVIANFTGSLQDRNGIGWYQDSSMPASYAVVQGNMYYNYGGGDASALAKGIVVNDSSPSFVNPQISGWTYVISQSSPVASLPNLPTGGWGPPGFVIPQTGTPPSSPH